MVFISLMNDTERSRSKGEESVRELKKFNLIKFPEPGGMTLKVGEVR
ncbi:Uncharacterised protein [Streptococcus porcinus]|nr:Uncharacterised protein [Streptococcus porcinus]